MNKDTIYTTLNESRRMVLNQKDGLYNVILTISGGSLVLSLSFIEKNVINNHYFWLLKLSWILAVICIIANILMRYLFNEASVIDLNKQHFKLDDPNVAEKFFKTFKPERKHIIFAVFFFWLFWISFLSSLISLLFFALGNT